MISNTKVGLSPATSSKVIDALGGTTEVSRLCSVSTAAVSQWRKNGISRAFALYLRERFKHLPIMKTEEVLSL